MNAQQDDAPPFKRQCLDTSQWNMLTEESSFEVGELCPSISHWDNSGPILTNLIPTSSSAHGQPPFQQAVPSFGQWDSNNHVSFYDLNQRGAFDFTPQNSTAVVHPDLGYVTEPFENGTCGNTIFAPERLEVVNQLQSTSQNAPDIQMFQEYDTSTQIFDILSGTNFSAMSYGLNGSDQTVSHSDMRVSTNHIEPEVALSVQNVEDETVCFGMVSRLPTTKGGI